MNYEIIKSKILRFFTLVKEYIIKAKIELIVLFAVLAVDLIVKWLITVFIPLNDSVVIIPNFLVFTYVQNRAAAFSGSFGLIGIMGETGFRVFVVILTVVAVAVFSYFMYRNRGGNLIIRVSLALIIAGALGNWVDRLFLGYVRDFVSIVFFGLNIPWLGGESFAVFNIADMALVFGVITFAIYYIFIYKEPKKVVAVKNADTNIENTDEELEPNLDVRANESSAIQDTIKPEFDSDSSVTIEDNTTTDDSIVTLEDNATTDDSNVTLEDNTTTDDSNSVIAKENDATTDEKGEN